MQEEAVGYVKTNAVEQIERQLSSHRRCDGQLLNDSVFSRTFSAEVIAGIIYRHRREKFLKARRD